MKLSLNKLTSAVTVLLVSGFIGTMAVNAQAQQNPARGQRGANRANRAPVLDEKQQTLLREAMQNNRDAFQALREKMQAAQKELTQAMLAKSQDEGTIRQKAEAVAKIQVEEMLLQAKAVAALVPTLTPEQREQLENSPFGMMMLRGGMRGGPMNRGGGGAGGGRGGRQGGGPPQ